MNFEDSLKKIQEILKEFEDGQLSLENSIILFKEGSDLIESCQDELNTAKLQVCEVPVEDKIKKKTRKTKPKEEEI